MGARRLGWVLVAGSIALSGTVGAALGARAWEHDVRRNAEADRARTASDISARATETIRRANDLALSFRGILSASQELTSDELEAWIQVFDPYGRQPGLLAFGYAVDRSPFHGVRPTLCPLRLVHTGTSGLTVPVGVNLCDEDIGLSSALGRSTDNGALSMGVVSTKGAGGNPVLIGAAVYRHGLPATETARRQDVVGWSGTLFDGNTLVRRALADHPGLWLEITHQAARQRPEVIGRSGRLPAGWSPQRTVITDPDGRWIVRVAAPVTGGLSAAAQGRAILLAGGALSILLALLVLVLSRSRDRALRLVATKTDQLLHQALHDPLTGLPNRALIMDRVEAMLARASEDDRPCAVMFIDLDDFKDINDTVGHGAGDQLLQIVARRLAAALRPGDTVGRLGGDEFVVLLEGDGLAEGAEVVAERLLRTLGDPYHVDGVHPLHVGASIGIAFGTRATGSDLVRDADVALYGAKAAGRGRVVVFESSMQERVQDRLDLETALREAVALDQMFLVYQPTFDLGRMAVSGVEALIRWRHPERGVLAPDTFIPLAEQTGLIVPIGRWVLREACRQAAAWQADGHPLAVSVNVSARQLDTDGLLDDVHEALAQSRLPAGMLTIEVTESAIMADTQATVRRITALKDLGVRIAIDDFGTGYSSLAYLQQFPVDQLKIDRSFIAAMGESPEATTLIRTLVQLGRALGIETLAEGIEEVAQRDHLQAEQCDFGQGYLFARPLVPEAIVPFVHRWEADALAAESSRH
ncbi:MAG: diguanylate cyclase/phosphodiesterase with sensor(s) [Actinomycetia bacterium]|nr:diguanylate cyclase/phosphodiesterase with sensor(s) [Actinomycetes bacterium]